MAFRRFSKLRKNAGRRYKRRTGRYASRSKTVRGSFAKRVRKVVERTAEQKVQDYFYGNKELYPTISAQFANQVLILTSDTTSNATYSLAQGTYQGQRIGNKVSTKKCTIKGSIACNPTFENTYNYNPNPMYATMWIVKLKPHLTDDVATLETVVSNSFFQSGNTAVGFVGTIVDMSKNPNQNHITVMKKRVFKVGMANYNSAFASNNPNQINQQFSNNDSSLSRMFSMNITKLMPKVQAFNDGTNITVARRVYLFWSVCRQDGGPIVTSAGAVTGPIPCYFSIGLQYSYTDV